MINEKDSAFEAPDATRIDMGDDLLESPIVMESSDAVMGEQGETPQEVAEEVADLFQNAKILMNEGLIDDAKKLLRQILIADPPHANAKALLHQIHEIELKQIFTVEEAQRPYRRSSDLDLSDIDSEEVLRQLDEDLNLGVFETPSASSLPQLSLFEDPSLVDLFIKNLEKSLSNGSVEDWTDLGIGFLEMELYPVAVRLFLGAHRRLDLSSSDHSPQAKETRLSVNCLLAFSLILANRPVEAMAKIEPLLRDAEIKIENKVELFYLMGRTYECMKKMKLAVEFYKQVIKMNPCYRDTDKRLGKEKNKRRT